MTRPRALLVTMRPSQWVKNVFVFAPALFARSHSLGHPEVFGRALLAAAVFILLSGAVYVMNDVLDVEKDRRHPVKRHRPIASGLLPVEQAVAGGLLCLAASWAAGFLLGTGFLLTSLAYLVLNVAYSMSLKHIAYLDVLSIALGFLLRVLAGSFAIGLAFGEVSAFLLICTFLVALYLAMGKRRHELAMLGNGVDESSRPALRQYRLHHLDLGLAVLAGVTLAVYAFYTVAPQTREYFGHARLAWTIPFVAFGLLRFLVLLKRSGESRSPTDVMIRDPLFLLNGLAYGVTAGLVIYLT